MYTCVYIDTLLGLGKVFHFIRAVSLEIASDGTVRGDEPSAARYTFPFSRIHFLRPPTHDCTYTHGATAIIKKIEGEGSLLIRLANCGTSPSNPSAILDPITFQEKPRLSLSLYV